MVPADPAQQQVTGDGKAPRAVPFGKYLLLERLAVGGMAEVYLAKSFGVEGFEKILAIKRILPTMAEDRDFIEMFIDEAKIAGQLSHANIVPIHELGKIGDSHYIAMDFVWGKDLLQIMNRFRRLRKRMPPPMVAWIAAKVCEALDYAHHKRDRRGRALHIIHRDVSPQNILVSYEGEVKVIDFGIARAASRNTKTQAGVLKGKFGYMSPEQVRGLPIDHRSDIFAVGTCMYEMLTSERLFLGESDFSTLERVRNADVPPVSTVVTDLPAEMDRIVMRALAREPADRWQTAGELQEALLAFVARDRPPFGTSKLSSWMKTAFAQEMAREKQRLEAYAAVGRPHVVAGPRRDAAIAPAPRPVAAPAPPAAASTDELSLTDVGEASSADLAGEATVLTASPFDEPPRAAGVVADDVPGDLADQPTQIFFSADDLEEIEEEGAPAAAPPSHAQVPLARPAAVPRPSHPSVRPTAQPATLASPGPLQAVPSIQIAPDLVAPPAPASPAVRPPDASAATGLGRSFALAALAAFVLLLAGAGVAYLIFGREQTGVVEIRTVPDVGATVLLDGIPRGNAPLRIERVAAGQHALEVRAEGFVAVRRVVDVGSDSTIMLDVVLERQPPMFAADFGGTRLPEPPALPSAAPTSSAPATASAPPAIEPGPPTAPSGSSSPSEERQAGSDSLAPHGPQRATAPSPGTVRAREPDSPSSAVASPRPSASGASTPAAGTPPRGPTPFASTSGSVGRPGARTEPAPDPAGATPAPQRPTSESATEARGYGTLVINTIPWARVFIDGRDTRRNTPIPELRVRAGTRRVGLQTPDGRMHEIEVEVPANETVRITRRL